MKLLSLITILLLSKAIYAYDHGCRREIGGKIYDFSKFNEMNERSHKQTNSIDGKDYTVYFEFCRQATNCKVGSSACVKYSSGGSTVENSLGSTYDFEINPLSNGLEGANLTYVNGDGCGTKGPRVTSILMTCSNSYTQITSFTEPSTCRYQIEVSSYYACPIDTKGPVCKYFPPGNNNPKYDLTPLKNNIYNLKGNSTVLNQYLFSYSICGSYVTCTLSQPAPAVCMTNIANQAIADSGGSYTQTVLSPFASGNGVSIDYLGGTPCGSNGSRQTKINIICDPSTEYQIVSVAEPITCRYVVEMKSKHACPKY